MPAGDTFVDRIYEAAFVPEAWPDVLDQLAEASDSAGAALILFEDKQPMRFTATGPSAEVMQAFSDSQAWMRSPRIPHFQAHPFTGFVIADEYFGPEIVRDGPETEFRLRHNLGAQAGTMIPMPTGEIVVFAFDRNVADGAFDAGHVAMLDTLCPHLSRAGLMTARLKLVQAKATVSTLEALGIPAAVLTRTGKVRAANALLDSVSDTLLPIAFGGLAISSASANRLFQDAIAHALNSTDDFVRSIPVRAHDDQPALVVHVLPVFRTARDVLFGADILIAVTSVRPDNLVPSPPILMGLFDLTPSEARIAASLASGKSLRDAAGEMAISFGSARTYLAHVFAKTGTNQQSQLVSLLKSSQPISTPQRRGG